MTSPSLKPLHTSQISPNSLPFVLETPPDTDLWLKPSPFGTPPSTPPLISTSQPTFYSPIRLGSFLRATTTVSFEPLHLYDQAGLVLLFPGDTGKWIKAGLEYVEEQSKRSVVVASGGGRGADWSVSPPLDRGERMSGVSSTIEFEREEDGKGASLLIKIGGEVVREVTWVFAASQEGAGEEEVWVGIYGARPAKGEIGNLKVSVERWELSSK